MSRTALYGTKKHSIDGLASAIEARLGISFERRSSHYFGDYLLWRTADERIAVRPNRRDDEGDLVEEDFPDVPVLVDIEDSDRWAELEGALAGIDGLELLRSEPPAEGATPETMGPSHVRQHPDREYFEHDFADRWPQRYWGYWGAAMERFGLPVERASDRYFRIETASAELRSEVADYLDAAPAAAVASALPRPCYRCGERFNMLRHLSDGVWLWHGVLGHFVRAHGFYVPNRLVDHIRATGRPPDRLDGSTEHLPWPPTFDQPV